MIQPERRPALEGTITIVSQGSRVCEADHTTQIVCLSSSSTPRAVNHRRTRDQTTDRGLVCYSILRAWPLCRFDEMLALSIAATPYAAPARPLFGSSQHDY